MIFVKNLESVSNQEWSKTDKYPGVRWKFLIDADVTGSSGLSLGFAEIEPGGDLILHYHSPAEIYVVTDGVGTLNKSGELEEIKKGAGIGLTLGICVAFIALIFDNLIRAYVQKRKKHLGID